MQSGLASKKTAGILGVLAVIVIGGGYLAAHTTGTSLAPKGNLFSLIANLNSTTGQVLDNTSQLRKQVSGVANQLEALNTQSSVLQQQLQTSDNLGSQLQTQVQLTSNAVSLMRQILGRQTQTEALTNTIAEKSGQLQGTVQASAQSMEALGTSIHGSLTQSQLLEKQLQALLSEMSVSEDEFKFFGQVKKLLSEPASTLQQQLGSLLGHSSTTGTNSNPLSSAASQVLQSNPVTGSPTDVLGAVTSILPH